MFVCFFLLQCKVPLISHICGFTSHVASVVICKQNLIVERDIFMIHLNFGHPLPSQHVDHLRRFGEDLGFRHLQRAQRQEHQDVLCWYGGLDGPRGHTQ